MSKASCSVKSAGLTAGKAVTDHLDESLLDLAIQAMHDADFAEISLERLAMVGALLRSKPSVTGEIVETASG